MNKMYTCVILADQENVVLPVQTFYKTRTLFVTKNTISHLCTYIYIRI